MPRSRSFLAQPSWRERRSSERPASLRMESIWPFRASCSLLISCIFRLSLFLDTESPEGFWARFGPQIFPPCEFLSKSILNSKGSKLSRGSPAVAEVPSSVIQQPARWKEQDHAPGRPRRCRMKLSLPWLRGPAYRAPAASNGRRSIAERVEHLLKTCRIISGTCLREECKRTRDGRFLNRRAMCLDVCTRTPVCAGISCPW